MTDFSSYVEFGTARGVPKELYNIWLIDQLLRVIISSKEGEK